METKEEYVVMPTFCTRCRKEARDDLGQYYVINGRGLYCKGCVEEMQQKRKTISP